MSPATDAMPVAAIVALLSVAALAAFAVGVRPRRRSVAEVRALLRGAAPTPGTDRPARRGRPGVPDLVPRLASGPLGRAAERRFGVGCELIDRSPVDIVSLVLVGTALGWFVSLLAMSAAIAGGWLPFSPLAPALVVAAGPLGGWFIWSDVAGRLDRARSELRRAANDVVQLTAVGLTTDQSVEEAIGFALDVGDSDMFDRLRREVAAAPARGVPVWEALDELGRRHEIGELSELASSIERQGTHGVSITDTVTTLAASMRRRALDQLERDADQANANLAGPTIGFVVATVVFLGYPLAIRISEAFT